LIRIRVDTEKYYPKFVFYLLRTNSFKQHINAIAFSTAAQPNMKIRDFLRFEFLDLPLNVQIKIADNLSDIDDKLLINHETNQTLEHIAQAIFKSWFVDFEPTHTKAQVRASVAEGRIPGSDQHLPPDFLKKMKNA
jgi:type I restriction enzyme S subunit